MSPVFGKLRSFFWPIHRDEVKVFLPMLLMFFFISFNYNILRTAKDSLILTAKCSGAEALPFLKTWAILPMSLLLMVLFTRLSNKYHTERVFYFMMGLFLSFFLLFAFVLYPFHESLHSTHLADKLSEIFPQGGRGLIAVFRNWTFTLFYVMSELWGTAIMTVLFWGFANEISNVSAAKRFYALFAVGGNISSILSGEMSTFICRQGLSFQAATGKDGWAHSLMLISIIILFIGLATIAVFRWLNKRVLNAGTSSFHYDKGKSDIKMGLRKNFAYLAKSKYLLCIAVIVVTYNIAINLTEVVWKDQVRGLFNDPNEVNAYMARVNESIGIVATVMALFCGLVIRKFSWTVAGMVSPLILLLSGGAFFTLLLCRDVFSLPLAVIVLCGSIQNCLSRASKYTFFDNTKELAFIPLSQECKLKGKAAIDGVGSRFGKSGGAVIYQFLLLFMGTIGATLPFVGVALLGVVGAWFWAVKALGKQFKQESQAPQQEELAVK